MITHFFRFHSTWSIITEWSIPKLITIVKFWKVRKSSKFFFFILGSPQWVSGKESVCNAGDVALIRGSENIPWRKECLPTQHSCLENPMDRRAWQAIVHSVSKESDMNDRQHHCIKYMKILTSLYFYHCLCRIRERLRHIRTKELLRL